MSQFQMDIDMDSFSEDSEEEEREMQKVQAVLQSDDYRSFLYPPERSTVHDSCPSESNVSVSSQPSDELSKIDMALALNKFTDEKLQRLEKLLNVRLQECRAKLKALHEAESFEAPQSDKPHQFRYVLCGKPYFKDKNFFPAPNNEDTNLMMKSEMYDFNSIPSVPGWTVKDKSEFINFILKMSQKLKIKELNSKISHLKRNASVKEMTDSKLEQEIHKLQIQIDAVNKKTLKELALPVEQEYDWDTISNKLNQRHCAHEYRALWKLFLHPSINKNNWSKNEHIVLQKIAYANGLQDWDKIAKELNTNRTGYQCFVYFRTNMNDTTNGLKWSKDEEELLKRLVDFYREENYIPWGKVAASMENRTKVQIYNKYMRLEEHRKGRFIPEEDAVILTCVDYFGTNNFRKIQQYLPGRSTVQLRNRYQVLTKTRVSCVWSVEEDKKLIQLMANQDDCVASFASICEHLPGKDRAQTRARYKTLMKWMKRFPNTDLSLAPRRGSRRLGHGRAMKDLNNALEKLTAKIKNEVQEKKLKTVTEASTEQEIDDAIVANLVTQEMRANRYRLSESGYHQEEDDCDFPTSQAENTTNLQKLLLLLRSKLNKERFIHSDDYMKYFDINQVVTKVGPTGKIKCYSRKRFRSHLHSSSSENDPDLWGNNKLGNVDYVLPPHLATITGCRKIMSYVNDHADQSLNVYFQRNKKKYKEQFDTLMERFNLLFLWPLLLSNENPDHYMPLLQEPLPTVAARLEALEPPPPKRQIVLPLPEITIPYARDECEECEESVGIDLPDDGDDKDKEEITIDTDFNVEFNEGADDECLDD